jgi:G3E family GTPase
LTDLEQKIRVMNAMAKVYRTQNSEVDLNSVLGVNAFDLDRALEIDPQFLTEDAHEHDATVGSIALVTEGAIDVQKLNGWISNLLRDRGPDIFRMKGILNIAGEEQRFVFQGVHMIFDGRRDRQWKENEHRKNELVFIGRNLDESALKTEFLNCLVNISS